MLFNVCVMCVVYVVMSCVCCCAAVFCWVAFVCASVWLFKCVCVVVCALSCDVVRCCMLCVWLLFDGFVWCVCGFACAVVWRVWFCDGVFNLCVACVRAVLVSSAWVLCL